MASNMEFVSAFSYTGNSAGAPPRGEQQVNELRRNSWMLEMERALLAAIDVTAAPELPPSLLAGKAGGGAASTQILPVQAAQGTVASEVTSSFATKVASSANPVRQAGTATLSGANVAFEGPAKMASRSEMMSSVDAVGGMVEPSASALLKTPVQALADAGKDSELNAVDGNLNRSSTALNDDLASINDQDGLDANRDSLESAQQISAQQMTPWFNPYQSAQMGSMYFGAGSQAQLSEMGLNPALSALRTDAASLSMLQSRLAVVDREPSRAILQGAAEMGADLAEGADELADDVSDGTRFMARSSASSKAMQAAQDAYAKRQLHLYPGEDGVQAWIRDVDLNQTQAQAVALALRQELNSSGLKLKTLTLNGRKLETPEIDQSLTPFMPVTQPDAKNE